MDTGKAWICLAVHYCEFLPSAVAVQLSEIDQLGGLHSNAYISDLFAKSFSKTGMKAYVELIQRKERELGTDVLTHQKV